VLKQNSAQWHSDQHKVLSTLRQSQSVPERGYGLQYRTIRFLFPVEFFPPRRMGDGRSRGANAASHPTSGKEKFAMRRVVKPILISNYNQTKECLELQSQPSVRLSVCPSVRLHSAVFNCVRQQRQQFGTSLTDVLHCSLGSFSALPRSKRSTNKHGGHALAPQGVGDASRRRSVLVATGDEDALSVL